MHVGHAVFPLDVDLVIVVELSLADHLPVGLQRRGEVVGQCLRLVDIVDLFDGVVVLHAQRQLVVLQLRRALVVVVGTEVGLQGVVLIALVVGVKMT